MYVNFRRPIEVLFILLWVPFLVPIFIIISLLIKIDSRGSVFYKQERKGLKGNTFMIYKFRTMRMDYCMEAKNANTAITLLNDIRITRLGKFLRKTHLDELPQLFNVLLGDMSIVGPRPEPVESARLFETLIENYTLRYSIIPGITGLGQVINGYVATVEEAREMLKNDLKYIQEISLLLDVKIVFSTILVMITGKGAR